MPTLGSYSPTLNHASPHPAIFIGLERVTNDLILKYNIASRVTGDLILKYNIVGRITQNLILKYNIIERVVQNLILKYNIVGRTVQNLILKYHIFTKGKALLSCADSVTTATTAGATEYWNLGNISNKKRTSEAPAQIPYGTPGTLSHLFVRVTANSTSASSTVTLRKNGADGNLTVTIPSGTTGVFEDTTHTDTVAVDDLINIKTVSGGTGTFSIQIISALYTSDYGTISKLGTDDATINTGSITRRHPIAGEVAGGGTGESVFETTVLKSGYIKNLAMYVTVNDRLNDTPIRIRKNRANTGIAFTVGAGQTGLFKDFTTAPVPVAANDEINYQWESGAGSESLTFMYISCEFQTNTRQQLIAMCAGTNANVLANQTRYYPIGSEGGDNTSTTESNVTQKPRTGMILSGMSINCDVNTVTANTTIVTRINGVDGNLTITIPASTTGVFTDDTNTDLVTSEDNVNLKIVTGATGTDVNIRSLAFFINSLDRTSENLIVKYNITSRVVQDLIIKYNILVRIVQDLILKYNIAARVVQNLILKYNIIARVTQNVILKYNILARVVQNLILKYNIIERVVQSIILKYNIIQRVTQNVILKYNILERAVQNLILKYNLVGRITNDLILKYNIIGRIVQNLILKYNIVGRVTQNLILKYNIVGRVTQNLILMYDILEEGITRVTNDLILKYNITGRAVNNLVLKYNIIGRITNNLIVKYNIASRVVQNLILKYNIAARVTQNLILRYNIVGRIVQNLIIKYNIVSGLTRITNDLVIKYNIVGRTINNLIIKYRLGDIVIPPIVDQIPIKKLANAFAQRPVKTIREKFRLRPFNRWFG